jgi:hypothetical protein
MAPISEVMKHFRLVVQEEEGFFQRRIVLMSKLKMLLPKLVVMMRKTMSSWARASPVMLNLEKSTVKAEDLVLIKKLGCFLKNNDGLIRFTGDEVIVEPKDDEVIVFKSFFRAGFRFPLYEMIDEVLKKFEIYLHQITPNAIVRLSVFGLCRVKEWVPILKDSAESMNSTTRPRQG